MTTVDKKQASKTTKDDTRMIAERVVGLREVFDAGVTKPVAWRRRQLDGLRRLLVQRAQELEAALFDDLRKSPVESEVSEIGFLVAELDHTVKNLRRWLRPKRVGAPAALLPASAKVMREPLGVVLVIAPWNYPVQLLLGPMIGALAAGNAVVAKPSELAPATSALLARLIPQYLDPRAVAVVEGAVDETTQLLEQRFDHIFYTGNGTVARIVMAAAVKNLTPVTLELGGKSPAYIDDGVDLKTAARRIVWGKFLNAGQTCVAPDYLLATKQVAAELEPHLIAAIGELYGADPKSNPDYGRIVNNRHFTRLTGLLGDGRTALGGADTADEDALYLPPTVLMDVPRDSAIMAEEIFGPILPVVTVDSVDDAIGFISSGDKPLALYVFSDSAKVRRRFLTETSSGAVGFGVPAVHLSVPGLPFGGVGESGMGAYHGEWSLDTFSHRKAVMSKPLNPDTLQLVYPPFTEGKEKLIRRVLRRLS